ncbi:MAG: N-acetylglucosamine-6-phosphate deacetylase [Tabrizicola sp.]|uniref:N-acetylglucosamine-6-phosphate deacetylase n=1 Tax=Tabrizicola sp. TaxID=2005166 RepID=UPI0027367C44|nr:N-acetylglucosamine-6-phosphate deacetylase [Tabrizicola sp.]MDP3262132.1 N-acetylglucosamine-6-phosphate deacetylase [Tabrizicola sp.]MDP3648122.1 N-acetylglucosamine-6-phosphate deacetylase [Paracoccaceae bacterium]MDZ4069639.1 N-acetylglucosamine-6-phosphate deacetylase [Tabrizicola sp.]
MIAHRFTGAAVFDGTHLHQGASLTVKDGRVAESAGPAETVTLAGGILAPGLLDLQVNGGGGRMIDAATDVATIREICAVHARLGATGILPTLITDTKAATQAVIAAGIAAARNAVPGFLGLHLEGPHLDPRRKGAHDPSLIRPMDDGDLAALLDAARALPSLMVTVAPEAVTLEQIARLRAAGVIVSLGHSETGCKQAQAAIAAGASCATHLFNAMSGLQNREPGLVGAVLTSDIFAGLIADGIHVDPVAIRVAMAAKPERIFLVSDAMAAAGSDATEFDLGGRRILRRDGRLTLADGTLAGADLSLPQALKGMVTAAGVAPATALAMATSRPAACLGREATLGHLLPGRMADMVHLGDDWSLQGVWRAGRRIV